MKGVQSIEVNRAFTLEELEGFFNEHWDRMQYNDFEVGDPTVLSATHRYVILPATEHWCVIAYPKSGGMLSKKHKIALSCAHTTKGAVELLDRGAPRFVPYDSTSASIERMKKSRDLNDEMRGPANDFLEWYTEYLRRLLKHEGFID